MQRQIVWKNYLTQLSVHFNLKKKLFAHQDHLKKIVCQENTEKKLSVWLKK